MEIEAVRRYTLAQAGRDAWKPETSSTTGGFSSHRIRLALFLSIGGLGACAAASLTGLYLNSPKRVAERFLTECERKDYARLHAGFDEDYRRRVPASSSMRLLERLHQRIPTAYELLQAGHPAMYGVVTDRHRYQVRVAFRAPEEARKAHRSFVISLVQGKDGKWRVAFLRTYQNLLDGLYGAEGEQYLQQALRGVDPTLGSYPRGSLR